MDMQTDIPENDSLLQAVRTTILKEGMLKPGDGVVTGVSGGRDSVALMVLLAALAGPLNFRLGVAHFHHGLRGPAADRDARLVEHLAVAHGLRFYHEQGDVRAFRQAYRLSTEEAAREQRYAFLEATAHRYDYQRIALGHHSDDNAELVLMRLLRGSGPRGLAGIPPVRPCGQRRLTIIRPLIYSDRAAIDRFCRRYGLQTCEDESNRCLRYTRNRIRHVLLPLLRSNYNPGIAAGLNRLAGLMRDEEVWLDTMVAERLRAVSTAETADSMLLDCTAVAQYHPALQRRVLRAALQRIKGDLRRVGFDLIEAVRRLLAAGVNEGGLDLPGAVRARRQGDRLYIGPTRPAAPEVSFEYRMTGTGKMHIRETGGHLSLDRLTRVDLDAIRRAGQHVAYFDMDQIAFPITIRNFRPGDRFVPFGLMGTQKLKKFFIDHKIPRAERIRHPLIISADEIIWIAGVRRSDRARIGPQSAAILKAELLVA